MASSNRSSKFASFVLGVVFGMGICAGAAYFLTTGPLPFVDKVDKVTADVDPAEALAGGVDPNQKLNQSPDEMTAAGSEGPVDTIDAIVKRVTAGSSDAGPARDASGKAVAPGQVKTATLWVQAGAFKSPRTCRPSSPCSAFRPIFRARATSGAYASVPSTRPNKPVKSRNKSATPTTASARPLLKIKRVRPT